MNYNLALDIAPSDSLIEYAGGGGFWLLVVPAIILVVCALTAFAIIMIRKSMKKK